MKVLMFGWDFSPHTINGLSNITHTLTKGLSKKNIKVIYISPYNYNEKSDFMNFISVSNLKPINHPSDFKNVHEDIAVYTNKSINIIKKLDFDIIQCNNWMTYKAGLKAKKLSKKPLIIHVQDTTFNRKKNKEEFEIEKKAFENADKIITASNEIKKTLIKKYKINKNKIKIVHYGLSENKDIKKESNEKTVLFVAKNIKNKEAEYFIKAAKEVIKLQPDTKFIVAYEKDTLPLIVDKAISSKISNNIAYTEWLSHSDIPNTLKNSDIVIVPHSSETFGLTALTAIKNNKPVIISKQSEISKLLNHNLKADFWDTEDLSNKIISLLKYKTLHSELKFNSLRETKKLNPEEFTRKTIEVYKEVTRDW